MLRQLEPFFEWVEREKPKILCEALVARFVLHLSQSPWRAPSVPEELLSERPHSETRKALLSMPDDTEVYLLYRQHFRLDGELLDEPLVDLLALTST